MRNRGILIADFCNNGDLIRTVCKLSLIRVFLAPVAHGTHDRAEITSFFCEDVFRARWVLRVKAAFDNAVLL